MLINPWRVVDFSSNPFLAQSFVGKSLIYCVILVTPIGYGLLEFNWGKIAKPRADQLHAYT